MKKILITTLIVLGFASNISAQQDLLQNIRFRTPFAYEQVTIDATAGGIALTAATYNPVVTDSPASMTRAELAVINCQVAQLRYRVDLVAAVTASVGMTFNAGEEKLIYGFTAISQFRGIRTTATSAVCDVTYYRNRQ